MNKKTRIISLSGKGGSGKTTITSLLLSAILRRGDFKDILVIDADPDANLSTTLKIPVQTTIGQVVDKRKKELQETKATGTKVRFSLWEAISHGNGFDFLVMGRTTGAGCYCSVNAVLTSIMNDTMSMYDLILIDFDAGLEHFSRRSANAGDTLLVTCDPSYLSFETAKRIKDLVEELSLPYNNQYLIGCRYDQQRQTQFYKMAGEIGLNTLGLVYFDPEIDEKNLLGENLLSINDDNPSLKTVKEFLERILSEEAGDQTLSI